MKRLCALFFAAIWICLLTGCSSEPEPASVTVPSSALQTSSEMPPVDASTAFPDFVNAERSRFNEIETNEVTIYTLGGIDVYVSAAMESTLVTVYEHESAGLFTTIIPFSTVSGFELSDEEKSISFYTDGFMMTPDQSFRSNIQKASLQYERQEIFDVLYSQVWYRALYGVLGSTHVEHAFSDECEVQENKIIFRMEILPDMSGMDYAGTEITLSRPSADWENGEPPYVIGFRDTPPAINGEFLEAVRQMEGIVGVDVNAIDSHVYKGTEVLIQCEEGYSLNYAFNTDGSYQSFKDFYLTVVNDG